MVTFQHKLAEGLENAGLLYVTAWMTCPIKPYW